jgi:hypothetical protein
VIHNTKLGSELTENYAIAILILDISNDTYSREINDLELYINSEQELLDNMYWSFIVDHYFAPLIQVLEA